MDLFWKFRASKTSFLRLGGDSEAEQISPWNFNKLIPKKWLALKKMCYIMASSMVNMPIYFAYLFGSDDFPFQLGDVNVLC